MRYLKMKGWISVSIEQFVTCHREGKQLPPKSFVLTFDDGYKNNIEIAMPILLSFGFTATIFITTAYIGKENSWLQNSFIPRLPMLSWADVHRMVECGFDIHPHGTTHVPLDGLGSEQITDEICHSRRCIEDALKTSGDLFCYPHGRYNERIVAILEENGFQAALTTRLGYHNKIRDFYRIKRIGSRFFRKYPSLFKLSTMTWGVELLKLIVRIKKKSMKIL
jgi:peptidoglycan/xylan/chitin deacetylase (PgdA/CDA1 family)